MFVKKFLLIISISKNNQFSTWETRIFHLFSIRIRFKALRVWIGHAVPLIIFVHFSSKVKIKTEDTSFSDDSEDSSRACSKIKEDEFGPVLVDFRSIPQSSSHETVHKITNPRSSSRETVHKISSSCETVHKIKKEPRESADESKLHRSKGSSLKDNIERRLLRKRRRSSSVVSDRKSRRYRKESRHSRRSSSRQRSNSRRIHGRYSSKEKRELSVYSDGSEIEFIEEVSNKSIQGKLIFYINSFHGKTLKMSLLYNTLFI